MNFSDLESISSQKWQELHWGDIATLEYGKGLTKYTENIGKYPVYGTNGLIGKTEIFLCKHPGVIIGRKGAYRGIHYSKTPFFVIDTAFYLEPKIDIDLRWAYYSLLTYDINLMDSGSAIPSTSRNDFYSLPVKLPPIEEQHAIAQILATFDDKIELNNKIDETLEAMVQAIYKSWFVDFDPVWAKLDGKQPAGMDAETAALFPSEFEILDGQNVPKGWKVGFLPDFIEVNPKRSLSKNQIAPYLDMQNVPTQGHRPIDWIERFLRQGTKFVNGDTLLARITPCLEHGKTIFVDFLNYGQVGWGSTEYIVLRPRESLPAEFGYFLARDEVFRDFAILNMSGSSGRQRVPTNCFNSYQMVSPSDDVAKKFGKIAHQIIELIKRNNEETRT